MSKTVRVLLVEDNDLDAAHFLLALRRGGFEPVMQRVETREEMIEALRGEWDIVVSDYTLPNFSAPEALETLKLSGRDLPFIVVSGAVGEETAVRLMRAGASDYLLKHRMVRLTAAIERELQQAEQRRGKRRAEELFQAVLRAAPQPSIVVDRNSKVIIDGSDAFRRMFLKSGSVTSIYDAIDFSQPERVDALLARGSGAILSTVYYRDGAAHVANLRCYSVDHDGTSYAYLVIEDVTEQNYLKAAFDAVGDPLLILSSRQTLLYANRAADEVFGQLYFGAEVGGLLSRPNLDPAWWTMPTTGGRERRLELGEETYEASCVLFRFAGESETSTILTLRNVSLEAELRRLATHDALTGIYNVRYFNEALEASVGDGGGALALVDLDDFKPINDQLGHAGGDAALITFANTIRAELRPRDVFARLGGDEFAVLFNGSSVEEARAVLEAAFNRLTRTPFRFERAVRPIRASAGLTAAQPGESADSFRKRADAALYEAKRQGKGRFVVA